MPPPRYERISVRRDYLKLRYDVIHPFHFADLSRVAIGKHVKCLELSQGYYEPGAIFDMNEMDPGLLNGLVLPKGVTRLIVDDSCVFEGSGARPKFTMEHGTLKQFEVYGVALEDVYAVCAVSHMMRELCVQRPPTPMNMCDLTMSTNLVILSLDNCDLTEVPSNLASLCPLLESLNLYQNEIETLEGVDFPSGLKKLNLGMNWDITVKGAVFPQSLLTLSLNDCQTLNGFNEIELPPELRTLQIEDNNIEWVSLKMKIPYTLKDVHAGGNFLFDSRVFRKHGVVVSHDIRGSSSIRELDDMYNGQDGIVLLFGNDVLPMDLVYWVRTFMP